MPKRNERGSILMLSLWATATLAALGIAQATRVSQELRWARRVQEGNQAWYLAWSGLELATARFSQDKQPAWDALNEAWAAYPEEPVPFDAGTFTYRVSDEQGKIPLNSAPQQVIERLPGFTPAAAAELLARRLEGKKLLHLAELRQLGGFDAEALDELEPVSTLHGTGPVNMNSAPEGVLTRLGLTAGLAQSVVAFRKGADGAPGTADDGVFTDVEQIPAAVEQAFGPLTPEDQLAIANLIASQQIGVRSSFFRFDLEGKTNKNGATKKAMAVLERSEGSGPVVREWREE